MCINEKTLIEYNRKGIPMKNCKIWKNNEEFIKVSVFYPTKIASSDETVFVINNNLLAEKYDIIEHVLFTDGHVGKIENMINTKIRRFILFESNVRNYAIIIHLSLYERSILI